MSKMKLQEIPKPLFLKTYGKQMRKLTPWLSPEDHKRAFDNTQATDGDDSVFEPAKPTRIRQKKANSKGKAVRPTRRKAKENITTEILSVPLPSFHQPAPQGKSIRKRKPVSVAAVPVRKKGKHLSMTSESEDDMVFSTKRCPNPLQVNTSSNIPHPSLARFVTCRQRSVATKPTLSKAFALDSMEDFTSGEDSLILLSPKRKRLDSSMESSSSSLSTNPLRATLLNESAHHSVGSMKPIFSSTPSVCPTSKLLDIVSDPIMDQSLNPSSLSVSCISVSTFPEDLHSPRQPCSAPPFEKMKQQKNQAGQPFHEGHSYDLSHPKSVIKTDRHPKTNVLSGSVPVLTSDSEISSCFVSAVSNLVSPTEALKQKCLTQHCTVRVERFDHLTVDQLCRQIGFSSCLDHLSSSLTRQTAEQQPVCADLLSSPGPSFDASLSAGSSDQSSTSNSPESELSYSPINLSLPSSPLSAEGEFIKRSALARNVESPLHTNSSFDKFTCAQLTASSPLQRSTEEQDAENLFLGNKSKDCVKSLGSSQFKTALVQRKTSIGRLRNDEDAVDMQSQSLEMALIQKCRTDKLAVRIQRQTSAQLKELQWKVTKCKSDFTSEVLMKKDTHPNQVSSRSGNIVASDRAVSKNLQKDFNKLAKKKKKRKSLLTGRPGTTRKACVSGLSVSRWKNDSRFQTAHKLKKRGAWMAADCTIDNLVSSQPKELQELFGHTSNFSTPVRTFSLNLSTDFTPHTQYWNRLKSSLSIHRKVLLTPQSCKRPVPADISQLMYDAEMSDAEKVYAECGQHGPLSWRECFSPQRMKQCVKIGEGTFGEVFSSSNASGEKVALKVIPVEGNEKVNGEDQKTLGEILHEIIISKELSSLKDQQQNQTSSFIGLNDLHCVRGCYPSEFLKAWDIFDQEKGSDNDRPDFFQKDQLFIILEFEFGGVDLENSNGMLSSLGVAKSILHQVTAALAVAEQQLHFEHRDLHWGNVLVKPTKEKTGHYLLNGTAHSVETKGVLVRIIDYSLSRLEIDGLTVSCDISKDEELFMGQGDYQFDIYRLMREENGNDWNSYQPHSNVLWLHYLCSKLLTMRYRGTGGRGTKITQKKLTHFHKDILQFSCATEALQKCTLFR
ncbi:uncharacterized protein haspin [Dunckerocampus dactyliophorus]|uniref:uncharacterized protein haspin n=1 Tax=Dunckerocampus dactyliophorus TaxID=161453 RepID=UPI0024071A4C|nr:uncharacterized protein haspin [Dunckerocampus dactyliophorus]